MIVASTTGPLAIHTGLKILEAGGSAMDAAIAISCAQIVLSGGSWNSFAGILSALYFESGTGRVHALSAGFQTVRGEQQPSTIPRPPKASGRTALVPGFMAGIEAARKRFGRVPLRQLLAPAQDLAENGFEVDRLLAIAMTKRQRTLSRFESTRSIFIREEAGRQRTYSENEIFRQPQLAQTLRALGEHGAAYMYSGAWAYKFMEAASAHSGKLTLDDLQSYRAQWTDAISTDYGGAQVYTLGLPDHGGVQLLEGLNLLSVAGLSTRPHYRTDPRSLIDFMKICRFGQVSTAANRRLAQEGWGRASLAAERIVPSSARRTWPLIQEPGWEARYYREGTGFGHSDAIAVADRQGNVAVLIHSINTLFWGDTGLFVDGVSIPDAAASQQVLLASVTSGDRLPTPMNPVIVVRNGRPWIAAGCIGTSVHEVMLQTLSNTVDFGMSPAAAMDTPKFWGATWPGWFSWYLLRRRPVHSVNAGEFSQELLRAVESLGQSVRELTRKEVGAGIGHSVVIEFLPGARRMRAAVSRALNGITEGH